VRRIRKERGERGEGGGVQEEREEREEKVVVELDVGLKFPAVVKREDTGYLFA
jgi:hypothetical protein